MADLNQFLAGGGGIESVQTGFIQSTSYNGSGSGEDEKYLDITISSVDVAKSVVDFKGGVSAPVGDFNIDAAGWVALASIKAGMAGQVASIPAGVVFEVIPRLINSTTLRLAVPSGVYDATSPYNNVVLQGRWTVVEGK